MFLKLIAGLSAFLTAARTLDVAVPTMDAAMPTVLDQAESYLWLLPVCLGVILAAVLIVILVRTRRKRRRTENKADAAPVQEPGDGSGEA